MVKRNEEIQVQVNSLERLLVFLEAGEPKVISLSAGVLYDVAKRAFQRIATDSSADNQRDALVSILFSAAAVEAFVNEFTLSSRVYGSAPPGEVRLQEIAGILETAEKEHETIYKKVLLIKEKLTDVPFDKGASPYQNFKLLIDLRNAIAHLKPKTMAADRERVLKALSTKKICAKNSASFLANMLTPKVARFSCNAACAMIHALHNCYAMPKDRGVNELWVVERVPTPAERDGIDSFFSPVE